MGSSTFQVSHFKYNTMKVTVSPGICMFQNRIIDFGTYSLWREYILILYSLNKVFSNSNSEHTEKNWQKGIYVIDELIVNPLSANPTKWSNTLKWQHPTNCLSLFYHTVGLAVKGLTGQLLLLMLQGTMIILSGFGWRRRRDPQLWSYWWLW